ncbi:tRNA (adenosine(37)-N6)-dimethylallyltransferase MiaA [Lactococcus cremoris]|uniref:tRNA (adenosine(37)-N6)-dimethylallyltransferase MiaA n=1 Tax=Lactococcus lactis subsp. cremoris TaxID=1359 RepID=UPI0003AB549F|nr:tRNA (adenosine(37)-N6)-dimethylallyltransferase MiaA [Lactococcus cremoris]AGV72545.1 tRNA delta(2)-isopentenylpyrophosphate transferase MiaA [Lactococcus cremoris subsp. cremoris KW2]
MKNNKVLVVVGPTAVGKTALGIDLAIKMNGEIISGDSQQVYQGLDIGTAKVTKAEQALAVHHLIDVRKWTENFSVHDFVMEANRLIEEIIERGNVPIIVGGTGLYIQSLIEGYHLGGQENHQAMMELRETLSALTDEELFEKVLKLNPNFPELNRRRAIRFLELQTFGSTDENSGSDYNFLLIGLNAERKVLYERINQRVEQMMSEGLLAEARSLFEKAPDAQAAKGIGYKEFFPYFSGEISLEEAVELVKRNSRRYAKRQLTWFRNRMEVEFEDVFSETYPDSVFEKVTQFLN